MCFSLFTVRFSLLRSKFEGGINLGLRLKNIKKIYGDKIAVNNISFEIEEPGVFGLLGTNGARENYNNKNDTWNNKQK